MTTPTEPLFEIVAREDTRSPVAGRPTWRWRSGLMVGVPAALVGVFVVWPLLATGWASIRTPGSGLLGVGWGHFQAILSDTDARHAIANSFWWLVIAIVVLAVGFLLALLGPNTRRARAVFIGGVAAPLAASAVVAGVGFRLMYDPQPARGTVTRVVTAAQDAFDHPSPLAGATPGSTDLRVDPATRDIITVDPRPLGGTVRLELAGVPAPAGPPAGEPPGAGPEEITGVVTVDGHAVPDVDVSITQLSFSEHTRTGPDGTFRFDLSDRDGQSDDEFTLHVPAAEIAPNHGGVPFLGPGWIWWVLGSAFAWGWMGFVIVVFRAGLRGVPRDLVRMARAYGVSRWQLVDKVYRPALTPAAGVIGLTLLVAAARVFDLVLVAAPGSTQSDVDVVGVHWWRSGGPLGAGGAAALAILMVVVLGALALGVMRWLNRPWPIDRVRPQPDPHRTHAQRWAARGLGSLTVVVSLFPLLVLLLTSLRSPRDAAVGGWWAHGRDGLGLESYRELFTGGQMGAAWVTTALRATAATVLLLVLAVPAAYALGCGRFSRGRGGRVMIGVAAVLAVVPVQAIAAPLASGLNGAHFFGTPVALVVLHAVFGVPFAVLLLRPAFRAAGQREALHAGADTDPESLSRFLAVLSGSRVTLVAVAVMEFVLVWNDLVVGLLLGPGNTSVSIALFEQTRQFATSAGVVAAGAVVSLSVPLLVVFATGKWVAQGLAAGITR